MEASGAMGQKFTKKLTIKYKPNWCSQGLTAYTQVPGGPITSINATGLTKEYGWLATPNSVGPIPVTDVAIDPSLSAINVNKSSIYPAQVPYNGHNVYIDQADTAASTVCRVVVTVTWVFKGAKVDKDLLNPTKIE